MRINGLDTHYMYRDVMDVMEQGGENFDLMMMPKIGSAADVYAVDMMVTKMRSGRGKKRSASR